MAKVKSLEIDMCAGSQLRDTQGEMLSVEGADISELEAGRGRLNDNHGKGAFNSIGRVTSAKKIFKAEDCEDDRQRYYWDKIKAPYIYVKGLLYNDEDHPNARAAAAILRNIHKNDAPLQLKASVEGGVMSRGIKDPSLLARTKIHSVALTFTPANNATLVEPISLDKSNVNDAADLILIKSVMHLAETNVPSFRHIVRDASAIKIQDNINKINAILSTQNKITIAVPNKNAIINNAIEEKIAKNIKLIHEQTKYLSKGEVVDLFPKKKIEQKRAERARNKVNNDPIHKPNTKMKLLDDKGWWDKDKGVSEAGADVRHYRRNKEDKIEDKSYGGGAWKTHNKVLSGLKAQQKPNLTKNELEKANLKSGVASALTSAAIAMAPTSTKIETPISNKEPSQAVTRSPSAEEVHSRVAREFPLLGAIGNKESSGGKRATQHKTMTEGPHKGHTAGGIYGMMPNSAAFVLSKDPELAKKYPKLVEAAKDIKSNHKTFTDALSSNPEIAADFAISHFKRNKGKTKSNEQLVYSWLNGLKGSWNKYKEGGQAAINNHPYVQDVMKEYNKNTQSIPLLNKALTAGYGGASAPTSMTGGSVIQTESLEQGRPNFKYVNCDDCGKEQVHAKHQVKCRHCGTSFSLEKLYKLLSHK